jgi:hypothetical protein
MRTDFLNNGSNSVFMAAWNVAGAFVKPNGITLNSQCPL